MLCRARNRVRDQGGRLRLVTGSPRVLRILRLTGLARAFDVYPRLSDALARTTPGLGGPLSATAG